MVIKFVQFCCAGTQNYSQLFKKNSDNFGEVVAIPGKIQAYIKNAIFINNKCMRAAGLWHVFTFIADITPP